MALYSLFQEALTAPSSARDIGQEMLHATLLLSCAFVGWCASSAMVSTCGWFQNCSDEHKAKEGSSIFREEVAAYVQAHNLKSATKHFGLSHSEIRNCINAVEESQCETAWCKVGRIWHAWCSENAEWWKDTAKATTTQLSASTPSTSTEVPPVELERLKECEYDLQDFTYSVAPAVNPGMILLEQYGVFGACSGTWSGPVDDKLENDVRDEKVEVTFASSRGYGVPSHRFTNGYYQYFNDLFHDISNLYLLCRYGQAVIHVDVDGNPALRFL